MWSNDATSNDARELKNVAPVSCARGGGGSGGGGGSEVDDTMTFSDDFMSTHGSAAHGRRHDVSRAAGNVPGAGRSNVIVGGGAVRIENAFPTLQEQGGGGGGGGGGGRSSCC